MSPTAREKGGAAAAHSVTSAAVPLDKRQAGIIVETNGGILTFILTFALSSEMISVKH